MTKRVQRDSQRLLYARCIATSGVVEKEEESVFQNRTADAGAKLVARKLGAWVADQVIEEIIGGHH